MSTSPPEHLRRALAAERDAGAPFREAWTSALGAAIRNRGHDRADWQAALEGTKPAWRSAYIRADPTPAELALVTTAVLSDLEVPIDDRRDRRCDHCHARIPVERHVKAKYCSSNCLKRASDIRRGLPSRTGA